MTLTSQNMNMYHNALWPIVPSENHPSAKRYAKPSVSSYFAGLSGVCVCVCVCVNLTLANPSAHVRCHSSPQALAPWRSG